MILPGARRKERWDHLFELFQEDADGWKQKNETTTDEVAREVTSFAANRAGWAKDRLSEISELSSGNEDVSACAPTTGPTKVDQTRFKDLKVHPSI